MATVTLKHVADHVGADRSTVSRVLRGKEAEIGISRQLAERIKMAAAELKYTPNTSARAIRNGRTGAAALLMSTIAGRSFLPSAVLDGIHDELAADDVHLTIAKVPDEQLKSKDAVPKVMREFMADGLIINYTHHLPPHLLEAVETRQLPAVWMNVQMDHDSVNPLNRGAARRATERMIAAGHRRIAYVDLCASTEEVATAHYSARDRRDGYFDAMRSADLRPVEWRAGRSLKADGQDEMGFVMSMLRQAPRPTAILCYWSMNVPPILRAAMELGLNVPRDLSLMTFSPEAWHDHGVVIDSMIEPHYEMGRTAASMLRRRVADRSVRLPAKGLTFSLLEQGTVVGPPAD